MCFLHIFFEYIFFILITGAYFFRLMELPAEELRYEEKRNKTGDVNDAIDYLKTL